MAVLIIFPVILQTVINLIMLSIGRQGEENLDAAFIDTQHNAHNKRLYLEANMVPTTLQNSFSPTLPNFRGQNESYSITNMFTRNTNFQFSIACNRTRNKGGGRNLKVEIQIICEQNCVQQFKIIFLHLC